MQASKILIISAIMTLAMCFGVLCVTMASGWERYSEIKTKISALENENSFKEDDFSVDVDALMDKIAKLEEKIDKINKDFQIDSGKIKQSLEKYKNDALTELYSLNKTQDGKDLLSAGEINAFAQTVAATTYSFEEVSNEEELNAAVEAYKNKIDAVVTSAKELAAAKVAGEESFKKLTQEKLEVLNVIDKFRANGLLNQDYCDDCVNRINAVCNEEIFKKAKTEEEINEIYKQASNALESLKNEAETSAEQTVKDKMESVKKTATDKIENEIFVQRQNHPELVAELLKIRKKYLDAIAVLNTEEDVATAYADFSREVYLLCG